MDRKRVFRNFEEDCLPGQGTDSLSSAPDGSDQIHGPRSLPWSPTWLYRDPGIRWREGAYSRYVPDREQVPASTWTASWASHCPA
jgi:hypothetical protein